MGCGRSRCWTHMFYFDVRLILDGMILFYNAMSRYTGTDHVIVLLSISRQTSTRGYQERLHICTSPICIARYMWVPVHPFKRNKRSLFRCRSHYCVLNTYPVSLRFSPCTVHNICIYEYVRWPRAFAISSGTQIGNACDRGLKYPYHHHDEPSIKSSNG